MSSNSKNLSDSQILGVKFGTSGLRGLATDLYGEVARRHVLAFAKFLLEKKKIQPGAEIFVGWDFRDSSLQIVEDVYVAIRAAGLIPIACGALPTPALVHYANAQNSACVMITGSHIPADRNGIKFYTPDGEISKTDEQDIVELVLQTSDPVVDSDRAAVVSSALDRAEQNFMSRCQILCQPQSLTGLKIGVYQHSTVARDLLVDVLLATGAKVTTLGRSETFVPVDTEAVSHDTQVLLRGWADAQAFDAVISADGDGDRPLVTDETGKVVRGDVLGIVTAKFLGAQTVATPITSSSGIEAALDSNVLRCKVGSPYVIAAMRQAEAAGWSKIAGFEANGGFLTQSPFLINGQWLSPLPTRDCFLPILALLQQAAKRQCSVSSLVAELNLPVAKADRLENFPRETATALLQHLRASTHNLSVFLENIGRVSSTDNLDGLRIVLEGGKILHFRASGNAPEFRCYVEAPSEHQADLLLQMSMQAIKRFAEVSM